MNKYQNLVFMSFPNQVSAMDAVNTLGSSLDILEFGSHHHHHVVLIASCETNPIKGYSGIIGDSLYLESPSPDLMKAYFHQKSVKVQSHLLVLESRQLSSVLSACHKLLKNTKFEIIDITKGSDTYPNATAYLANDSSSDVLPHLSQDIVYKLFAQPNPELLKFF